MPDYQQKNRMVEDQQAYADNLKPTPRVKSETRITQIE